MPVDPVDRAQSETAAWDVSVRVVAEPGLGQQELLGLLVDALRPYTSIGLTVRRAVLSVDEQEQIDTLERLWRDQP